MMPVTVMAFKITNNLTVLFSSVFRITTKKTSKLRMTIPLWEKSFSNSHRWIPPQRASGGNSVSMPWRLHGTRFTLWYVCCSLVHTDFTRIPHIEAETKWPHFADDTFKRIFLKENVRISIKFSLKFVSKGPTNNIPALSQIMAWRRSGAKLLSEPMVVRLPMHICVAR